MSQTSVAEQGVALDGMKADMGADDVLSRLAEGDIPMGRLCAVGTDKDAQAIVVATATDVTDQKKVLGVSLHSHDRETLAGANPPQYSDEESMNLMHKGRIYVKVEEAVTTDSPVFARVAAGGNGLGSFRASDPGGSAAVALPADKARYLRGAGIDGLAVLELDL